MTLAGAAVTIGLALLAAQGPRAGVAKRKKAAPAVASERRAPARTRAPVPAPAPRRSETATSTTSASSASSAGTTTESASSDASDAAPTAAGGKTAKTKVYTFGAMDVEGKLKTPQLLYFLNRVKLELEMSAPDHRSFMKELERTADDPSL
ncbi:MAG TPA: hypothetical protein VIU64_07290 [Polyangia bacterium]